MKSRQAPYDDFIMDHIRNARNYRALELVSREATASNPLCGDLLTVRLHVARGRVEDAAFQCECCGISMASASMMTDWVRGRALDEARQFARQLIGRLARGSSAKSGGASEMERALAATVRDFPSRSGCATLAWTTLEAMLDDEEP
jgi:nitrogen fixation NifU-like protein